jgi:hypothetical protein
MAHPQTQKGDHICLLEVMSRWTILRPYERTAGESAKRKATRDSFAAKEFLNGVTMTNYSEGYQVVAEAYVKAIKGESLAGPFSSTFFVH